MQVEDARHRSRIIDRSPVYYGWVVLGAATVGLIMTIPGQTVGVSVFLDRIIADLGLSRSTVSLLYTIGTLLGSLALPFVGRVLDRRGPRPTVIVVAALFALACGYMTTVSGLFALAIGFVLLRGLGQGSLSLVSIHVINLWFVRRRGFAVGAAGFLFALATGVFPSMLEALNSAFGWRATYGIMAAMVACIGLPLGALFFRSTPEMYGLRPDRAGTTEEGESETLETNFSLAQARRTFAFWILVAADAVPSALGTGLVFHHFDIVAGSGIDRVAAAAVFVPVGLTTAALNLSTGVLLDRIPPRVLVAVMLAFQAAGLIMAGFVSAPLLIAYGVILGVTSGMRAAISGSIYAYYFGRNAIGSIKGTATTINVAGSAVGPLLFAVGRDVAGNYLPVLALSSLVPIGLAVAALWLRPPGSPEPEGQA